MNHFNLVLFILLSLCQSVLANTTRTDWHLLYSENFTQPFDTSTYQWEQDPLDATSKWNVDLFDDNGEVWKAISDPAFSEQMKKVRIFRQSIPFGKENWLTAELAYLDYAEHHPTEKPTMKSVKIANQHGLKFIVPRWDGGAILRASQPLPREYRVEMRLRAVNFGGKRNGKLEYDGKYNGYKQDGECKTAYPWLSTGALQGKSRCDYHNVRKENGFYYLTILDHVNAAPHGNPSIHFRRKVVLDGYYSFQTWSQTSAVCNPKSKTLYPLFNSSHNVVNAIFILGDRFKGSNNYLNNGYAFKTECGDFEDSDLAGNLIKNGEFEGIISSAELQPELLPEKSYLFAVERHKDKYVIEMSGDFKYIGETTLRAERKFIENGKPIWHYNQTAEEYNGEFNRTLIHKGVSGEYKNKDIWQKDSAYPDNFIIGDPHLNFYEGDAVIQHVKLFVPRNSQ